MNAIAPLISDYFNKRLAMEHGVSQNTIDTYSYSFQLLFEFVSDKLKRPPSDLIFEDLDAKMICNFLEYLESSRDNSAGTRNTRLAAIKSFFKYVEYRLPENLEQIRAVLAIPKKKADSKLVSYLNREEVDAILDSPDLTTKEGLRDYTMIYLCLNLGLRVSELTGLKVNDVKFQETPSILIHGKGRKERILPLWDKMAELLRQWLAIRGNMNVPELFVNRKGEAMTRWGFRYILDKHTKKASLNCPSLTKKKSLRTYFVIPVL